MSSLPIVSILIATYQREKTLMEAIDSLQHQSLTNWQAVVVDNADSATVRNAISELKDSRIVYDASSENLGECGGRNRALALTHAKYVCYLDDDDILPKNSLQKRVEFLSQHNDCGMIFADYMISDSRTNPNQSSNCTKNECKPYQKKQYYDALLKRVNFGRQESLAFLKRFNYVRGGTPLIRKRAIEAVGGFDTNLKIYGDYDLWLKLITKYSLRYLDRVVYNYRIHDSSSFVTLSETDIARSNALAICHRHDIRNSIQFSRYQRDINKMWSNNSTGEI